MAEPISVGRVENPDELDLDLQTIEIVGYTLDRKEVSESFRIRPVSPAGASLDVIRHTDPNGNVAAGPVIKFLDECVLEDDREAFDTFLRRPDVMIEQQTLVALYQEVSAYYAARPTRPQSAFAPSGSSTRRTSRGVARSRG